MSFCWSFDARRAGVVTLLVVALPGSAAATRIDQRTLLVSDAITASANGPSGSPTISDNGQWSAFASTASNLGVVDANTVSDVYLENSAKTISRLSNGPDGTDANGPSGSPSIAATVPRVAFTSFASNLVPGDANGVNDVFWAEPGGTAQRVSVAAGGGNSNGVSDQPDISPDGRYLAFSSAASNLVRGDTNGKRDVFLRDLASGTTQRVSVASNDGNANGASGEAAVSADGHYVAFSSGATNLVRYDRNKQVDIFVRDLRRNVTERISVSTKGVAQNASVAAPFEPIVDISGDGRFVVWDSDATNLVTGDRNGKTDVFLRDRTKRTTIRVSVASGGAEGDNDSFAPSISRNGQAVGFSSLADNLAPGDSARENVFLRDLTIGATSVVGTGVSGERPVVSGPAVLDRPSVADGGNLVLFASAADNLVGHDGNGVSDVFLRRMSAPQAIPVRLPARRQNAGGARVSFKADDPAARQLLCTKDRIVKTCSLDTRLPRVGSGIHTVTFRLGGPGLRFDPKLYTFLVGRDRAGLARASPRNRSGVRTPVRGMLRSLGTTFYVIRVHATDQQGNRTTKT